MLIRDYLTIAALVYAALLILSFWARHRPTLGIRLHTASWGTVYVLQCLDAPYQFKVGFTTRRVGIRQAEIEKDMLGGRATRIVYTLRTPFAESVERVAHRRLKHRRHRCAGGIEFFKGRPDTMISAVRKAGFDIRRMAKRQRRWSVEDDLTVREWVAR